MSVKYYIPFYDIDGNKCQIDFDIAGYTGTPIKLLGGAIPLTISYNGDPEDLFQQIITSKATIQVDAIEDFLNDTRDIDDQDVPVSISYGNGLKWVGFLIADQRVELFRKTANIIELTAVDAFSYLKETGNRIISTSNLWGLQRIYDIIKEVVGDLEISVLSDTTPLIQAGGVDTPYSIDGLFKDVLMRCETFMEDGLLISGYDIISSICDMFCLTSFVFNGLITFRQVSLIEGTRKIGVIDRVGNEWIEGNEQITRTRGVKQLGVKQTYLENLGGSLVPNNYFYFLNPANTLTGIVNGWNLTSYPIQPDLKVTTPLIKKDDFKGIIISGQVPDSIIRPAWTAPNIPKFLTVTTDTVTDEQFGGGYMYLRVKYKYHTYDQTQPTKNIRYGLNLIANFSDGSMYGCPYSGDSGRLNKNAVWNHLTNSDPSGQGGYFSVPEIVFPLANSESEQTFEITIDCTNLAEFPTTKGSPTFTIILWPIQRSGINSGYVGDHTGPESMPPNINLTEVSLMPDVWSLSDDEDILTKYKHLFSYDETNIRNNKKYSKVQDTVELKAGVIYGAGNTYADPKAVIPWANIEGALCVNSAGLIPIEKFKMNGNSGKLITVNAMERMNALRFDRNQMQVDVKSSQLKFTDVLEFPNKIDGKYIQVSDEYDVRNCIHELGLLEVKNTSDTDDIIENNLISE